MKKKFEYAELNPIYNYIALKCYDAICKRIKTERPDGDLFFIREYRWNVQHNQIKPANISRKILTPHWDIIGKMIATKILIKLLKL